MTNEKLLELARQAGFYVERGVIQPAFPGKPGAFDMSPELTEFAELVEQQAPVNAELLAALKKIVSVENNSFGSDNSIIIELLNIATKAIATAEKASQS